MSKNLLIVVVLIAASGCGSSVTAAEPPVRADELEIQLHGVRGKEGNIVVAVYADKTAFDTNGEPVAWISVPAGTGSVELGGFPFEEIAIVAFHDANANGKHDMQDDMPLEGWGNSGHVPKWSFPSYEAALTTTGVVPVQMHYSN